MDQCLPTSQEGCEGKFIGFEGIKDSVMKAYI